MKNILDDIYKLKNIEEFSLGTFLPDGPLLESKINEIIQNYNVLLEYTKEIYYRLDSQNE